MAQRKWDMTRQSTHHGQRSVAIFKWADELPGFDVESDPERLTTLTAKAPAEAIHGALRSRGYCTNAESPCEGEGGWHFTVEIDGLTFGVFTLWTGIGDRDYFAVQTDLKRGVFAALFLKPVQDERLEPVCRVLDEAFAVLPRVKDLHWLSAEQFKETYSRGESFATFPRATLRKGWKLPPAPICCEYEMLPIDPGWNGPLQWYCAGCRKTRLEPIIDWPFIGHPTAGERRELGIWWLDWEGNPDDFDG